MPYLNETGLQTFWNNCKRKFANAFSISATSEKVTITLKDSTDDHSTLSTQDIPLATASTSGVMSSADKAKLNGIEAGATANAGTITEISSTSPIVGSGTSGAVALSHATSGVTAGAKGETVNQTPSFGGTFKVTSGTVNATGHLTAFSDHTVKIPNTVATDSANGLMASTDKAKLDKYPAVGSSNVTYLRNDGAWSEPPGKEYTATSTSIGSASLDEDITADDITSWNAGSTPSLTITQTSVLTNASLTGGAIPEHNVSQGKLTLKSGSLQTLSPTTSNIGSASNWSAGTLPSLAFTEKMIPNIAITPTTVLTELNEA